MVKECATRNSAPNMIHIYIVAKWNKGVPEYSGHLSIKAEKGNKSWKANELSR